MGAVKAHSEALPVLSESGARTDGSGTHRARTDSRRVSALRSVVGCSGRLRYIRALRSFARRRRVAKQRLPCFLIHILEVKEELADYLYRVTMDDERPAAQRQRARD